MDNPQLENGYTRIANKILEELCKVNLSGSQRRILDVVFRQTYGYQRKSHEISLTFISKATGLDKRLIQRQIAKLIEMNIILVEKDETSTNSRRLAFNKNFKGWSNSQQVVEKTTGGQIATSGGGQIATSGGGQIATSGGGQIATQIKKEKKDKEIYDYKSIYNHYIKLDLVKHRTFTDDMRKAISSAMKNNKYTIEYCMTLLDRHKQIVERTKDDGKYAIKPRSLEQFFGQKVFNAKHLICSEYDEGGDKYLKLQEVPKEKTDTRAAILAKMMEEQELE